MVPNGIAGRWPGHNSGWKIYRAVFRESAGPLNTGGNEKRYNPATNCPDKNSLVGLCARPRGIAPSLQPGQMGEWVEREADMLGAGSLNVVILCHGNPSLAHLH